MELAVRNSDTRIILHFFKLIVLVFLKRFYVIRYMYCQDKYIYVVHFSYSSHRIRRALSNNEVDTEVVFGVSLSGDFEYSKCEYPVSIPPPLFFTT